MFPQSSSPHGTSDYALHQRRRDRGCPGQPVWGRAHPGLHLPSVSRGQMEDKLPGQNRRLQVILSPSFQSRSMEGLVALPEDGKTVGKTVLTVDFFSVSAILGNICLKLLGVHFSMLPILSLFVLCSLVVSKP